MTDQASDTFTDYEAPLDPDRPIIDPHQHLWDPGIPNVPAFFTGDMAETIRASGHNVTHTVYLECWAMYRQGGPDHLKPVGEMEYANGMAAMSASGRYGPAHIAAAIVGAADLSMGARVAEVLEAHRAAAPERFRGIRVSAAYAEEGLFGHPSDPRLKELLVNGSFQEGARTVGSMGYTLDIWCLHTQLAQLAALADACSQTPIILDHVGTPLRPRGAHAPAAGEPDLIFDDWRKGILALAQRPNVRIKLGGLGMDLHSFGGAPTGRPSAELANEWRPYVETCIEAVGTERCMFESNYPPDGLIASYGALWNAFKIIAAQLSDDEKDSLFRRTAAEAYSLAVG